MHYDTGLHQLIFTQFYKNGITLIDSNFDKIENIKTIDTVIYGMTKGGSYRENNNIIYSNNTPQFIVNSYSCVDPGYVY